MQSPRVPNIHAPSSVKLSSDRTYKQLSLGTAPVVNGNPPMSGISSSVEHLPDPHRSIAQSLIHGRQPWTDVRGWIEQILHTGAKQKPQLHANM